MLTYEQLKKKAHEFLAATGMAQAEFEILLPHFALAYEQRYPTALTWDGKARARAVGAGVKGALSKLENKLLFTLV